MKALTHFFLSRVKRPKADLVARTVNAILDLDPPIEPDHVSKLTANLRAMTIDPDDDYMSPD